LIVLIGGGRKLLRGWRARGALGRLNEPDVAPEDVAAVVEFGREGLMDLFRILGTGESTALRHAAGQALALLWGHDELIAEEEKALVRRGFEVNWHARRRYPRNLEQPIPMAVSYGIPFLHDDAHQDEDQDAGARSGRAVAASNLEWSHTIVGAGRAALETPSPWKAGPGRAEFALIPGDFTTDGPHRLILKARVRTTRLTDAWELDLPQMPLSFEFDPRLAVDALFSLPDAARAAAMAAAVRLVPADPDGNRPPSFLDLHRTMALREPPSLGIMTPLPCDLAHAVAVEFEDIAGRFPAGAVLLSGQGTRAGSALTRQHVVPLGPIDAVPEALIDHPGRRRIRAILRPDAERGWVDPEIRSIWPEEIVTEWVEVDVVRR
jgi:hypothetical protein